MGELTDSPPIVSRPDGPTPSRGAGADKDTVIQAINARCDHFLVKPIDGRQLLEELRRLGLVPAA